MNPNEALNSLRVASADIAKLEALSNQFRTSMLLVSTVPGISITGDPEMKAFLEERRSIYADMSTEDLLTWIDVFQAHLTLFGKLAREKNKVKIETEVAERAASETKKVKKIRAATEAKRQGKIFVDQDGDEIIPETAPDSLEPTDKKKHKAIQGLMKSLKIPYAQARDMVNNLKV